MYRVRYLEQTDKMSQQVHLHLLEEVYAPELLQTCVQQSAKRQQKPRRLRHFTALSVLWLLLAMVLYHERWEIEIVVDEIKTHLRVQQKVLRSHTPEGVRQELYALFVVHFAIRALMYRSALQADLDPDRLSFTEAVFQIGEAVAQQRGEPEPAGQPWRTQRLLQRLRRNLLPSRRLRINRRELKQVYHKYKPKKREAASPTPFAPGERFEDFVVIVVRPQGSKQLAEATPLVPI